MCGLSLCETGLDGSGERIESRIVFGVEALLFDELP